FEEMEAGRKAGGGEEAGNKAASGEGESEGRELEDRGKGWRHITSNGHEDKVYVVPSFRKRGTMGCCRRRTISTSMQISNSIHKMVRKLLPCGRIEYGPYKLDGNPFRFYDGLQCREQLTGIQEILPAVGLDAWGLLLAWARRLVGLDAAVGLGATYGLGVVGELESRVGVMESWGAVEAEVGLGDGFFFVLG
ncbi:MAG: hypothetical protein SGPRY_004593, partial [Prymnesium sp.]